MIKRGKMPIKSRENLVAAWAFLIGIIIAVLVGIFTVYNNTKTDPFILGVLSILGLIVGFSVAEKNVQTFLLASVSLVIVFFSGIQGLVLSAAVGTIEIGQMVTSVLGALLVLFVPATIIVALKTIFSLAKS